MFIFFCLAVGIIGFMAVTLFGEGVYQFEKGGNNTLQKAHKLQNPEILQYVYGTLGAGFDTLDFYTLEFTNYTPQVTIRLLKSQKEKEEFHPSLIFIDPNSTRMLGQVPYGVPERAGGRIFEWKNLPLQSQENSAALETFFIGPQFVKDISAGQYTLVVYDPLGHGGQYELYIGSKKQESSFTLKAQALFSFVRIKLHLY